MLGQAINGKRVQPAFQAGRIESGAHGRRRQQRLDPREPSYILEEARVGSCASKRFAAEPRRQEPLHLDALGSAHSLGGIGSAGLKAFVASACTKGGEG